MSLVRAIKITAVKTQRMDQRLAELLRCRQKLVAAESALVKAQAEIATFKRQRHTSMQQAYAAILGEQVSETALARLNLRLERLAEQEKNLSTNLDGHLSAISTAREQLDLASEQFHSARRNRDKWELMLKPMRRSVQREAERQAEIERDERSSFRRDVFG